MKYYLVPTSSGALGKNLGCEKAPFVLSKIFKVESKTFEVDLKDIELQQKQIFEQAKKTFSVYPKEKKIFFGGTHDITFSIFKAFAKKSKNSAIVIFDAHADSDEGLSTVSHEDFVRALVSQKIVQPENILIFGARKIFPSESEFVEKSGIKLSNSKEFLKNFITSHKRVYFSFDVDVLDPNIMSATHYTEINGIYLKEAKELVDMMFASKNVLAIDVVEYNPKLAKKKEESTLLEIFSSHFS